MNQSFDIIQFVKTLKQRRSALEEALEQGRKNSGVTQFTVEDLKSSLAEAQTKSEDLKHALAAQGGGQASEDLLVKKLFTVADGLVPELQALRSQASDRFPDLAEQFRFLGALEAEQLQIARMQSQLGAETSSSSLPQSQATPPDASKEATPYLAPGHVLGGRYKVAKVLGKGGTGAVYGVTDQRTPQIWALKELWSDNPTFNVEQIRHQLQAEVRVLSGLRHPNLPRIVDSFEEGGRQYIVMDYVEGQSLSRVLTNHKKLPVKHALEVGLKLANVLAYLHAQEPPIIFRDLKPANIMVKEDGDVKLVDFGIARYFAKNSTHDTQALGTPGYAAPEQYGGGQSDQRSDVYALGANLHQMLTGINPGNSPFRFEKVRVHCAEISPEFELALSKCVELDQVRRPESVQEFREEILEEIRRRNGGVLPAEIEALQEMPSGPLEDSVVLEESQALVGLPAPNVETSAEVPVEEEAFDRTSDPSSLDDEDKVSGEPEVSEALAIAPLLLLSCLVPVLGLVALVVLAGRLKREGRWSGGWGAFSLLAVLVQSLLLFLIIGRG